MSKIEPARRKLEDLTSEEVNQLEFESSESSGIAVIEQILKGLSLEAVQLAENLWKEFGISPTQLLSYLFPSDRLEREQCYAEYWELAAVMKTSARDLWDAYTRLSHPQRIAAGIAIIDLKKSPPVVEKPVEKQVIREESGDIEVEPSSVFGNEVVLTPKSVAAACAALKLNITPQMKSLWSIGATWRYSAADKTWHGPEVLHDPSNDLFKILEHVRESIRAEIESRTDKMLAQINQSFAEMAKTAKSSVLPGEISVSLPLADADVLEFAVDTVGATDYRLKSEEATRGWVKLTGEGAKDASGKIRVIASLYYVLSKAGAITDPIVFSESDEFLLSKTIGKDCSLSVVVFGNDEEPICPAIELPVSLGWADMLMTLQYEIVRKQPELFPKEVRTLTGILTSEIQLIYLSRTKNYVKDFSRILATILDKLKEISATDVFNNAELAELKRLIEGLNPIKINMEIVEQFENLAKRMVASLATK